MDDGSFALKTARGVIVGPPSTRRIGIPTFHSQTLHEAAPIGQADGTDSTAALTTWWLWRGENTRSHSELGRENPQRRWYCVTKARKSRSLPGLPSRRLHLLFRRPATNFPVVRPTANAGWSSPVARQAHNLKVIGSNPIPATKFAR